MEIPPDKSENDAFGFLQCFRGYRRNKKRNSEVAPEKAPQLSAQRKVNVVLLTFIID